MSNSIFPRCKMNRTHLYVNASGDLFPCCWIANADFLEKLKVFLGADFKNLSLKTSRMNDILNSSAMRKIEGSWKTEYPFSGNQTPDQDMMRVSQNAL